MSDIDPLEALTEERERFKVLRDSIDEDLARQRFERLAAGRGQVNRKVLEAFAAGNTMNAIKRAYGTKDYKTIKTILDNGKSELDAILAGLEEKVGITTTDSRITVRDGVITIDDIAYDIIELEEDEYMLDPVYGSGPFDGQIVSEYSKGFEGDIYFAIKDAPNGGN